MVLLNLSFLFLFTLKAVLPPSSSLVVPDIEPHSFLEASKFHVSNTDMNEEFSALIKQGTWTLVPPPKSAHIIGCHWIYKIKHNSDGTVASQISPVLKQPTLRLVLSLALHNNGTCDNLMYLMHFCME